jgi:hypothetical protein
VKRRPQGVNWLLEPSFLEPAFLGQSVPPFGHSRGVGGASCGPSLRQRRWSPARRWRGCRSVLSSLIQPPWPRRELWEWNHHRCRRQRLGVQCRRSAVRLARHLSARPTSHGSRLRVGEPSVFDFQRPAGAYGGTLEGIYLSWERQRTGVYVSANDPYPVRGHVFRLRAARIARDCLWWRHSSRLPSWVHSGLHIEHFRHHLQHLHSAGGEPRL